MLTYHGFLNAGLPDARYDRFPSKNNCSPSCGNISVPYPFGLEKGCSANQHFLLTCTCYKDNKSTNPDLLWWATRYTDEPSTPTKLVRIDISQGLIILTGEHYEEFLAMDGTASTRVSDGSAKDFVVKNLHFAITNQTCKEAQQNTTGYACVSVNSTCLAVNTGDGYIGYRCKCKHGFEGNPYIKDGCQGLSCPFSQAQLELLHNLTHLDTANIYIGILLYSPLITNIFFSCLRLLIKIPHVLITVTCAWLQMLTNAPLHQASVQKYAIILSVTTFASSALLNQSTMTKPSGALQ